jgi:hypothetical protein
MEVVYQGIRLTAEEIAESALQRRLAGFTALLLVGDHDGMGQPRPVGHLKTEQSSSHRRGHRVRDAVDVPRAQLLVHREPDQTRSQCGRTRKGASIQRLVRDRPHARVHDPAAGEAIDHGALVADLDREGERRGLRRHHREGR